MKFKYNKNNIKLIMSNDKLKEWEPFRFKARPAKAGTQTHFNIPAFAIRNKYVDPDKEYTVYYIEVGTINIDNITIDMIKKQLSFKTTPAKAGNQYRLTIPTFLIKNKYFDPEKKAKYWVFMVDES